MGGFGQVIQVNQIPNGFLGEPSRVGGGDPYIQSRQANPNNAQNINFGDAVVLLPDATGGTVKQFADWIATGGGLAVATATTNANPTITPSNLAGLSVGMLVFGTGISAGTYITAINPAAGTATISKNATATNGASVLNYAIFAGFAVREVKTQFAYNITPGQPITTGSTIGSYSPGQFVGILGRGGITLLNRVGAPVAGGPVYIRVILNGGVPAGVVGGIESNSDTVNSILLAPILGQVFYKNGFLDSNNMVEVVVTARAAA